LLVRKKYIFQMFKKKEFRNIFSHKNDDASEQFWTSHNKDIPHLYRSPATVIIRVLKCSRTLWAEHVAEMQRRGINIDFWWGRGTRWCSWLRHYATSRKVESSFIDKVIGFFTLPNPSSPTMPWGRLSL
jgi:hypothetical protein